MTEKEAQDLLYKYRTGQCTDKERRAVETWLKNDRLNPTWNISETDKRLFGLKLKKKIDQSRKTAVKGKILRKNYRYAAAAIILLLMASVTYYMLQTQKKNQALTSQQNSRIVPGSNKALLSLPNGKKIQLNPADLGTLTTDREMAVQKTAAGEIVFAFRNADDDDNHTKTMDSDTTEFYTVSTPKGGQFQVHLPDGSRVWLNAASSLKIPRNFNKKARIVDLNGEAYFEITRESAHIFTVRSGLQNVTVLGTNFNVHAYAGEIGYTTVVTGAVQVKHMTTLKTCTLKKNQQVALKGQALIQTSIDAEQVIAWKNGLFVFDEEPLSEIMKKIARWYNVVVVYEDPSLQREIFYGIVDRFSDLSKVLDKLEITGNAHFKILDKEKKIIISKKSIKKEV